MTVSSQPYNGDSSAREPARQGFKQSENTSPWGFRSVYLVGAMALLLLLVIALMLPDGPILAFIGGAAPGPDSGLAGVNNAPMRISAGVAQTTTVTSTAEVAPPIVAENWYGCIQGYVADRYHRTTYFTGWTVTTTLEGRATLITVQVDAAGNFAVPSGTIPPGLGPGVYRVELGIPQGWEPITPSAISVTITTEQAQTPGSKCDEVRFKVGILPMLQVIKRDQDAPKGKVVGLPDWQFTATGPNDVILMATTDGQGVASFGTVNLGNWTIAEQAKVGWQPVTPAGGVEMIDIVPPNQPVPVPWIVTRIFVNKQVHTGEIIACKWDATRKPLCGWEVTVTRDDGTQAPKHGVTAQTAQGECCAVFRDVALGAYTVTETVKPWFRPDPAIGDRQPVMVTTPGMSVRVDFVNEPLGCIEGQKIDYLGNPLAGWVITATNTFTGDKFQTVTDSQGNFEFAPIPLGPYTVEEAVKSRWSAVTPAQQNVTLTQQGPKCIFVRFKNIRDSACLDVYKKDVGDPKQPGIAGWTISLKPSFPGGTTVSVQTDGTGFARFDNLTPGIYDVFETMQPGWVAVSAEQFTQIRLDATEPCRPHGWTGPVVFRNRQTTDQPPPPDDPPPAAKKVTGCHLRYTVRHGDNLFRIALRFGTTTSRLAALNHLRNVNLIVAGQSLCVK